MAAILPDFQAQLDLRDGKTVLVTKVTTVSVSDTVTLPSTANDTAGAGISQVRDAGENAVTSLTQSSNTLTIVVPAGDVGKQITIISLHGFIHSGLEA